MEITAGGRRMKKKLTALAMGMILAATVLAGCGKKTSEVSGTFMDKKDFMFTVVGSEGEFYGFNFDEEPENYDEFENGDQVKVVYTGTLSEVDPFDGTIISIEKTE